MAKVTTGFGGVLILTGIIAYIIAGGSSLTALIPAVAGLPLCGAGWAMTNPAWKTIAYWAALGIAGLMILGAMRGLIALYEMLTKGGQLSAPAWLQLVIVVGCLLYIIYGLTAGRNERKMTGQLHE